MTIPAVLGESGIFRVELWILVLRLVVSAPSSERQTFQFHSPSLLTIQRPSVLCDTNKDQVCQLATASKVPGTSTSFDNPTFICTLYP